MDVLEGLGRRLEVNLCTRGISFTYRSQRCLGHAMTVELFPDLALAADGQHQLLGQRIDHRNTYAVESTGYLVGVVIELRSEEHTSELPSLMRNSSAVFCWQ